MKEIEVIYEDGVFKPLEKVELEDLYIMVDFDQAHIQPHRSFYSSNG